MSHSYWLLKTEPDKFNFSLLLKDKNTNWNGVRNFQARNYLKNFSVGDIALIYHSGLERSAVGIAKVTREAYPDPDPKKIGEWVQVDLEAIQSLPQPVSLAQIKATPGLKDLPLIKQSRLSVMPITEAHYQAILTLAETRSPE